MLSRVPAIRSCDFVSRIRPAAAAAGLFVVYCVIPPGRGRACPARRFTALPLSRFASRRAGRPISGAAARQLLEPLRPRRLGQSFGPEPLCRFATSPRAAGRLSRGQSPRKKPPLTGEVAELARPEGLCRLAFTRLTPLSSLLSPHSSLNPPPKKTEANLCPKP